jgi:hypothetical protein
MHTAVALLLLYFDEAPTSHTGQVLSQLASLAVVLTLLAAIWQVRIMAAQLTDSKDSARMTRGLDFGRRWNDLAFYEFRKPIYSYLRSSEPKDLAGKIHEDHDFASKLWFVLNFYEEIGTAYNKDHVDQDTIRSFYLDQVIFLYEHTRVYIEAEQKMDGQHGLWRQFTTMAEEMTKRNEL